MTNDITHPQGGALSTDLINRLMGGIADSRASTPIMGGKPLLRLLRHGVWVYGQQNTEVHPGSRWVVNIMSLQHGYVCWTAHPGDAKNEMLGEVMAFVGDKKPLRPEPVQGWPFNEQRGFELKCINGDDRNIEVLHKTASVGGLRGVDQLLGAVQAHLAEDAAYPCPVLDLQVDSYQNKKWGQIFIPIYTIADWATMTGGLASQKPVATVVDDDPFGGSPIPPVTTATSGRRRPAAG